ncbi:MAG TPA: PEP-CTERM sorting domain-containing protein, partial [Chthoniobacteraceae bacterium]|nr:PEP-CTERM sorting domain-containing protein [Chthoniobacteraceae bacterium]
AQGTTQFLGGGNFTLKLNTDGSYNGSPDGFAGSNWDTLSLTTLSLSSTTLSTTPFVLTLQTLNGSSAGALASFDPTQSHTWAYIATFFNLTGTFSSSDFVVNSTNFLSPTDGGSFSVIEDPTGYGLDLLFTPAAIPEPGTWAMFLGGIGVLAGYRKIRSRR